MTDTVQIYSRGEEETMAGGKPDADKLEDDVAAVYRQLGYVARQQASVDGMNVDVVVEWDQPGGVA